MNQNKYIITPLAVWICTIFPLVNNFIEVNLNGRRIYLIMSFFLVMISLIFYLKKRKEYSLIVKNLEWQIVGLVLIVIFSFISYFTSQNENIFSYLYKYIFIVGFSLFLLNERNIILKRVEESYFVTKYKYYLPILTYISVNFLGAILQYSNNSIYNKYVLGKYYELSYGYRFGGIRYSGMFCWPNLFAYSTGAIYILTYSLHVSGWIRILLLILIAISKVRTVLIAILFIEGINLIYNNRKTIVKNIKKVIFMIFSLLIISLYYSNNFIYSIVIAADSYNYRLDTIKNSILFVTEKNIFTILFGAGLGRFSFNNIALNNLDSYIYGYLNRLQTILGTSDTYYTIIPEVGIVGSVILLMIFISLFIKSNKINKLLIIYLLIIAYSTSSPFSYYGSYITVAIVFIYNFSEKNIITSRVGE